MINDAWELARVLAQTPLGEREVTTHEVRDTGELLFAVDITEAELVPAWSAARGVVAETGRWPAVCTTLVDAPSIDISTIDFCCEGSEDAGSAEELGAVVDQALREIQDAQRQVWKPSPLETRLSYQLLQTTRRCGVAPDPEEVLNHVPNDVSDPELERWLLEWEEEREPTVEPQDLGHLDWFFDPAGAQLMFFPTASGPCSLAYAGFWAEEAVLGMTPRLMITILEYWRRRYRAELVANWLTMLEFVVTQPPRTLDAAWELAVQQDLIAGSTLSGPGVTIRDHARALINRPTWFLHNRP